MTQDLKTKIAEAIERVTEMADRWEDDAKLEDMVRAGLQGELDLFHETPRPPNVNLRLVRAAVDAESNAKRFRKDAAGAIVPAWFITELTAKHNDRLVLSADFGTAVSKNPYLAFKFKGGAVGDKISVMWKDNKGETRTDEAKIA